MSATPARLEREGWTPEQGQPGRLLHPDYPGWWREPETGKWHSLADEVSGNGQVPPGASRQKGDARDLRVGQPGRAAGLIDGASWLLDGPDDVESVWGQGQRVLLSKGEPLLVTGPDGVGKTTLMANLAIAAIGIVPETIGHSVLPIDRVLFLASDRPRQIRRRFRQLVGESERPELRERLVVRPGVPPFDLVKDPTALARLAADEAGAGLVIVDSLGAIVAGLASDEVGSRVRTAMDAVIEANIELVMVHHNRKPTSENREPRALADVYGSRWITAGAGSVISLWGTPGAPIVSFRHLKQPAEEVGPFRISVGADGLLSILRGSDLRGLLAQPGGVSAREAAIVLYETDKPSEPDIERARRALEGAVSRGEAQKLNQLARGPREAVRYGISRPTQEEL